MSWLLVLSISIGGAAGALARALAGRWIRTEFPLATLLVNILGSFLLALTYTGLSGRAELLNALIGAGFCGAFTTFSTFILETIILWRSGQYRQAVLYLVSTIALCCLASWLGIHLIN